MTALEREMGRNEEVIEHPKNKHFSLDDYKTRHIQEPHHTMQFLVSCIPV